jgi:hypothetical protein
MGNYFASEDRGKPKLRSLSPPMHLLGPTTSLHGTHPPGVELEPLDLPVPPPTPTESERQPPARRSRARQTCPRHCRPRGPCHRIRRRRCRRSRTARSQPPCTAASDFEVRAAPPLAAAAPVSSSSSPATTRAGLLHLPSTFFVPVSSSSPGHRAASLFLLPRPPRHRSFPPLRLVARSSPAGPCSPAGTPSPCALCLLLLEMALNAFFHRYCTRYAKGLLPHQNALYCWTQSKTKHTEGVFHACMFPRQHISRIPS